MSLFLFPEKLALLSIFFLVFSDPVSSFFGIKYGKDKILKNKSLQGSVAGFCVCYLISLIYCLVHSQAGISILGFSLLAGVIGSLSELLSVYIDDNLTIPVASGAGLTLLNLFFNVF